jgi:predicted HicB family RNase H-like nuclease
MTTFALRLPDSLHAHATKLAERDQASLNQFIILACVPAVAPRKGDDR